METHSPSSTIETIDEDQKDVYHELNGFMPPPPILDTAQAYHSHLNPSIVGYNSHGNVYGTIHGNVHGNFNPGTVNGNVHGNLNPGNVHGNAHGNGHGNQFNGQGFGISNSPVFNRQNSIQSNTSFHLDNDSNNNPSIFSQSNTSYTSFQDLNSFDTTSEIYNLTDYEIGSLDSINDSFNPPPSNYQYLQNQYFEFHNSNHFLDYSLSSQSEAHLNHSNPQSQYKAKTNLMVKTNLSTQSFSDISPLNNKYKFDNSTPKSSHLPQLTTFHHHPSLPNLRLSNGDYDRHSSSSTPVDSPIRTPDSTNSRRKKKSELEVENYHKASITSNSSTNSSVKGTPASKKYTRRRLLPRSKNGCWICRIKHLKCDELRPTCNGCAKYGIYCDYSPDKPNYVTDKNLRHQKLIEISQVRKTNQKLKPKKSKKRLDS